MNISQGYQMAKIWSDFRIWKLLGPGNLDDQWSSCSGNSGSPLQCRVKCWLTPKDLYLSSIIIIMKTVLNHNKTIESLKKSLKVTISSEIALKTI